MTHKENVNWGTGIKRRSAKIALIKINNPKLCKPVSQYDLEGNFIKDWPSAAEVQRQLGFKSTNITKCCKGIIKRVNKYTFKYKDE